MIQHPGNILKSDFELSTTLPQFTKQESKSRKYRKLTKLEQEASTLYQEHGMQLSHNGFYPVTPRNKFNFDNNKNYLIETPDIMSSRNAMHKRSNNKTLTPMSIKK